MAPAAFLGSAAPILRLKSAGLVESVVDSGDERGAVVPAFSRAAGRAEMI